MIVEQFICDCCGKEIKVNEDLYLLTVEKKTLKDDIDGPISRRHTVYESYVGTSEIFLCADCWYKRDSADALETLDTRLDADIAKSKERNIPYRRFGA